MDGMAMRRQDRLKVEYVLNNSHNNIKLDIKANVKPQTYYFKRKKIMTFLQIFPRKNRQYYYTLDRRKRRRLSLRSLIFDRSVKC